LIIGHRGSSALAPENTLAAFARAMSEGADGIEFDVRLAQDGVPVIIHDATLRRTARIDRSVSKLTSTQLIAIDAGSWFNDKFPQLAQPEFALEKIPTLEQLFALTAGSTQLLYLEMKSEADQDRALAAAVVQMIRKHALADRVIVESFNLSSLQEVKAIDNGIRTAALFEPRIERPTSLIRRMKLLELAVGADADEIALHHSLVNARLVQGAVEARLPVVLWTVDDPSWIERGSALGIRALITNHPARLLAAHRVV
jgi:glycerophosphoryl diester phosphodiesterase